MVPSQPDLDSSTEDAAPVSRITRGRVLVLAVSVPLVTGYVVVAAVLALVTAIAPRAHFSVAGVLAGALPGWLAAHQVPVVLGGSELGVLPLLPTVLVVLLGARVAAYAAARLGRPSLREIGQVVGSMAVAHGVCGVAVATLEPSRYVDVDPLAGFYYPALLAGLAAAVGVLPHCGLAARADEVALRGLAAGGVAVVLLLAVGAVVFAAGLAASAVTARELFGAGGIGMLLLCLGYLPNAVIAATAFVAGPGFAMGGVSVSVLEFSGGRVPGVPLLAALPESQAVWWPLLCLLPVGVGLVLGRRLRDVADGPLTRLRAVAVATGVVAVVFVVLPGSAGGRLGTGPFDPVTVHAAAVSTALVLTVGIPAAIVVWLGGPYRPIPAGRAGPWEAVLDDLADEVAEDRADEIAEDRADEVAEDRADGVAEDRADDRAEGRADDGVEAEDRDGPEDGAGDRAEDRVGQRAEGPSGDGVGDPVDERGGGPRAHDQPADR